MSDNPIADKDWEEAEFRARALSELPERLSPSAVERAMHQLNVSRSTLFRLVKQFREDGRTGHFYVIRAGPKPGMPTPRSGGGRNRISPFQGVLCHPSQAHQDAVLARDCR